MIILKRFEAFERAVKAFGPWNTWGRANHLAYGLVRGVPYAAMERTANDNPFALWPSIQTCLEKLEALPSSTNNYEQEKLNRAEVHALVVWVPKPPRERRARPAETDQTVVAS